MRMIFAVVVACWGGMMVAQTNDVVADVRMSVSTVVSSLPNGTADTVDRLRNFGVHAKHLGGYQNLVEAFPTIRILSGPILIFARQMNYHA